MFLILIFALAVLIGFSLESLVEQPTLSTSFSWVNECTYAVVRRLALPLFGTHSREQVSCDEADEKDDSLQKAVESTKKEMISEMAALETVRVCFSQTITSSPSFLPDFVLRLAPVRAFCNDVGRQGS